MRLATTDVPTASLALLDHVGPMPGQPGAGEPPFTLDMPRAYPSGSTDLGHVYDPFTTVPPGIRVLAAACVDMNSDAELTGQRHRQAARPLDAFVRHRAASPAIGVATIRPTVSGHRDQEAAAVARQVSRVVAWPRLDLALHAIAVDLLGPNESDELPAASAEWVAMAVRTAVSGVCDTALDGLVEALDELLVDAPPDVVRRLEEARIRHDAGFN